MTAVTLYRGPKLCKLAGITYRQLDYWCRIGLLLDNANGSGTQRLFEASDVCIATAIGVLSKNGMAGPLIRLVVQHIAENGLEGTVTSEDGTVVIHLDRIPDPTLAD